MSEAQGPINNELIGVARRGYVEINELNVDRYRALATEIYSVVKPLTSATVLVKASLLEDWSRLAHSVIEEVERLRADFLAVWDEAQDLYLENQALREIVPDDWPARKSEVSKSLGENENASGG